MWKARLFVLLSATIVIVLHIKYSVTYTFSDKGSPFLPLTMYTLFYCILDGVYGQGPAVLPASRVGGVELRCIRHESMQGPELFARRDYLGLKTWPDARGWLRWHHL